MGNQNSGRRKAAELSEKQSLAIKMMINDPTLKDVDVAKQLSIDPATLWRWKQEKLFISEYDMQSLDKYRWRGQLALKNIEEAMRSDDEKIKLNASLFLAKLAGHTPIEKSESKQVNANPFEGLTKEQIEAELAKYRIDVGSDVIEHDE